MDVSDVGAAPEVWEKVVQKLRGGMMPPAGRPRPERRDYDGFQSWLEEALDRAATDTLEPGRVPTHRLNRAEYTNAIRDLLALDIQRAVRGWPFTCIKRFWIYQFGLGSGWRNNTIGGEKWRFKYRD